MGSKKIVDRCGFYFCFLQIQSVGATEWKVGLNKVWESKSSFCHDGIALPVPVALPQELKVAASDYAPLLLLLLLCCCRRPAISTARTLSDLS